MRSLKDTTYTNSGKYIELQDLWKSSNPTTVSVEYPAHSTTATSQNNSSTRRRPATLRNFTASLKSPTLPFYPTHPLSPNLLLPPRPTKASKSRSFESTKQKTSAAFHRFTDNLHIQIHSCSHLTFSYRKMNPQSRRLGKKGEAKRSAKEEFQRNWDAMNEAEQAAYTKEREEAKLRERKRLEDVKNGNDETRKADAKTAAFSGSIVVCM